MRDHRRRVLLAADGAVSRRLRRRLLLRRLLRRLDPEARPARRNSRHELRDRDCVPGRSEGLRRRRPVLSRARRRTRVFGSSYGARAPTITTHPASQTVSRARRSPSASVRPARRRCAISGSATAPTSPARPRRTTPSPSVDQADNGARFRAVVSNDFGNVLSNERGADRDRRTRRRPRRSRAGRRHAVQRRHDHLRGHGDRSRGRHAAGERIHVAGGLPPRHPHASVPAPTSGATSGSFTIPDDRADRGQRLVPHLPDGADSAGSRTRPSATSCRASRG